MINKNDLTNKVEPSINEQRTGKTNIFHDFNFNIQNVEDTTMRSGDDAFIIYLTIHNLTSKSRKINLLDTTYVTTNNEELEQDVWLSGYLSGENTLRKNTFKKAGAVFFKSKLKKISINDIIYISVELPKEGTKLELGFQKTATSWEIVDNVKTEIKIKLTPKQRAKQLLKIVERLDAFEERLDVELQNFSIKVDDDERFTLFFELHSKNGTKLKNDVTIECVLYGKDGHILETSSSNVYSEDFFGFELFEMRFYEDNIAEHVNKIRIYPKK